MGCPSCIRGSSSIPRFRGSGVCSGILLSLGVLLVHMKTSVVLLHLNADHLSPVPSFLFRLSGIDMLHMCDRQKIAKELGIRE